MAIGSNKARMLQLEHATPMQSDRPVTAGGGALARGAKLKGADRDGIKRKVRGVGIEALRAKKHKFVMQKGGKK